MILIEFNNQRNPPTIGVYVLFWWANTAILVGEEFLLHSYCPASSAYPKCVVAQEVRIVREYKSSNNFHDKKSFWHL